MKKCLAMFAFVAMAVFALSSCQEKDPNGTKGAGVYFSADNGNFCFYIGAEDARTAEVALVRENSKEAAEYTIKVNNADDGVVIPETVSFEAGKATTTIVISVPEDSEVGDVYNFDIQLTGPGISASSASELGTIRCECTIYLYREVILTGYGSSKGKFVKWFGYFKQVAWYLDEQTIILRNFLGSEENLTIKADENSKITSYSIDSYEMYEAENGYGATSFWFCHPLEDSEDWYYTNFYPQGGEDRYIYALSLDNSDGYTWYWLNDDGEVCINMYATQIGFRSESAKRNQNAYWEYIYFTEYTEAEMADIDYETMPEIASYPEAVEIDDDSKTVLEFYLDGVRLDDQECTVTTNEDGTVSYTVANLWWSDLAVTFTSNNGVLEVSAIDNSDETPADGLFVDGYYSTFISDGFDAYFCPWDNDYDRGIYCLSYYNAPDYCSFDDEDEEGSLYAYWYFWSYDESTDETAYGDYTDGNLEIYVK